MCQATTFACSSRPVPVIVIVIAEYPVFVRWTSTWHPTIQIFYNEKHVLSIAHMLAAGSAQQLASGSSLQFCNLLKDYNKSTTYFTKTENDWLPWLEIAEAESIEYSSTRGSSS